MRDRVCSILSVAVEFCLAQRLGHLTLNVKSVMRTLNFKSDVTYEPARKIPNDIRKWSLCDVKCQRYKKLGLINNTFECNG